MVEDPYRWLEDGSSAETRAWTEQENALTAKVLGAYPGRAELRARLKQLYSIPGVGVFSPHAGHYFQTRRDGLQNHSVTYVSDGAWIAPRRVALDPNKFSSDGTTALDWSYTSPDAGLIAYGKSSSGDEQSTLYVRDVRTGRDLPEAIPRTREASVCWDADGKGFSYGRNPEKGQVPNGEEVFHLRIFHHRLGADWHTDSLLWGGEGKPIQEFRSASPSSDFRWQFLTTSLDWAMNDLYIRRNASSEPFRPVAVGLDGEIGGDVFDGKLYLRTNINAPRYHVVVTDPEHPEPSNWKEIIPQFAGVLESMDIVGGKLVILTAKAAVSHLLIFGLDGQEEREIPMPTLGTVGGVTGEPGRPEMFYSFTSLT